MNNIEINTLINKWQEDKCVESRNKLIIEARNLIYKLAYKYKKNNADVEDVANEAVFAVMNACDKYDVTKAAPFFAYASLLIKYKIRDINRRSSVMLSGPSTHSGKYDLSTSRRPTAHSEIAALAAKKNLKYAYVLSYTQSKVVSSELEEEQAHDNSPQLLSERIEKLELIQQGYNALKPLQQRLFYMYYIQEKSIIDIARELNITKQAVHASVALSVDKIRRACNVKCTEGHRI